MAALGLAALFAAVLTGAGSAKQTALGSAKFHVSGASQALGAGGGVKVKYQQLQSDDPVAKVTFYVPLGYQVTTSQSAGTQLGTAAATIFAADLNAVVPVTGTVEIGAPGDFALQATACTGTTTHTAYWVLRLSAAGTPLLVPAFVDAITVAPLSAFAVAQIVICLPPGDVPVGTMGRATLGAKVLTAEFTSNAIVNPTAAGDSRWRATVTPYTPNTGKANAAATIELQSIVSLPSQLTISGKARKSAKAGTSTVSYSGTLRSNGKPVADGTVDVFRGPTARGVKKFKSQTTDDAGRYTGSFAAKQAKKASAVYVLARATVADQDLGATACTATFVPPASPFPIPCQDATVGGFTLSSNTAKVTIPAAPKKKK
jgi:hypothetical protein